MSIMNKTLATLFVTGLMGYMQGAMAYDDTCHRNSNVKSEIVNIDAGTILVPIGAPVGTVFYKKFYASKDTSSHIYSCKTKQEVSFTASLVSPGRDLGDGVYATNIKGIGIRISRGYEGVENYYPGTFKASAINFTFPINALKVELIKTEETTGSGPLRSGMYSTYIPENESDSIITGQMSEGGTIIATSSCVITSPNIINVKLDDSPISYLNGAEGRGPVGNARKNIDITVRCGVDGTTPTGRNISITFSGDSPKGSVGIVSNGSTSSNAAKGIGFALIGEHSAITLDKPYPVVNKTGVEGQYKFPLRISYALTGETPTTGEVSATVTYTVTYN